MSAGALLFGVDMTDCHAITVRVGRKKGGRWLIFLCFVFFFSINLLFLFPQQPGGGLGGGIGALVGFLAADTLRISGCTAPFSGGAMHFGTVWTVTPLGALGPLTNLLIEDNVGGLNCGGISAVASGHVQVASSILRRNAAPFLGGAAIALFANMTLTDTVVENNM